MTNNTDLVYRVNGPWVRFLIVPCSTCHATTGKPCIPLTYSAKNTAPHVARRDLARVHPDFVPLPGKKN